MSESEITPEVATPILGVDPVEAPESVLSDPNPEKVAEVDSSVQIDSSSTDGAQAAFQPAGLTEPDWKSLNEKADWFDKFMDDPGLSKKIVGHYDGQSVETNPAPTSDQPVDSILQKRMDDLTKQNQAMFLEVQLMKFGQSHPDFENHRQDMAKLAASRPNFSLDELYDSVKMTKGHQVAQQPVPRPSVSEGRTDGVEVSSTSTLDALKEAMAKNPSREAADVLHLAWDAAMKLEAEKQEGN